MRLRGVVTCLGIATTGFATPLGAQSGGATVREYRRVFPTYPFGDPNPIAVVGRVYPYFRFDGFAHRSEQHSWKVVELENDYLRVMILPEVGGKIWNAVDKRTNRSFIYFNQAVKFRDVAMRGPWTSGGIEANYGIIGHTPNVATPVDYVTRTNADGSVSCIIGALDLLTRTPWRMEIRLGARDAAFSTSSFWYNASPIEQPYYSWMNAGIKVTGNLQFIYPGTSYLGHAGEHAPWPINAEGRDISWYDANNFGGYKSYHVFGQATDFFGAYWHRDDFGMVRYAPRDEKAGKKIWIWGLSRQGMIWESLLTDVDGQYAEVQSGRLFNQSAEQSTFTPFKHRGFAPHTADRWTEYWYPVAGIKGIVTASRTGAMNVTPLDDRTVVAISPVQPIEDTLRVFDGARLLYSTLVSRRPLQLFVDTIATRGALRDSIRVILGDDLLSYRANTGAGALQRPLDSPASFNWRSAYGQYLQGKEWLRQREYEQARAHLDSALALDPLFPPSLVDRAMLAYRSGEYEAARRLAMNALSIDTYDGGANYYYGLASRRLGKLADATDGFELAALTPDYRGAAWTELARMSLAGNVLAAAAAYADKALGTESGNLDALGVAIVAARRRGDGSSQAQLLARLEAVDPLSHQARLERLLASGDADAGTKLAAGIRAELPEQVLLDLAAWYLDVGDADVARRVLEAAGDQPEALYWRAYLDEAAGSNGTGGSAAGSADNSMVGGRNAPARVAAVSTTAAELVERANSLSPRLVFPFRPEMVDVLVSAVRRSTHWKPRYYLGLTLWSLGRTAQAGELLQGLGEQPDFPPFYATRASFPGRGGSDVGRDLTHAAQLDTTEWRYGKLLAEYFLAKGDTSAAVDIARTYHARLPASYLIGLTLAKALIAGRRFREADALLAQLDVLPHEGAAEAHAWYRQAKLMLAVDAIGARQWKAATGLIAAARLWPERLGEGKPYDADERLEDWLLADVLARSGNRAQATAIWTRLATATSARGTASDVVPLWSLERLGRSSEAKAPLAEWPAARLTLDPDGRVLTAWRALPSP